MKPDANADVRLCDLLEDALALTSDPKTLAALARHAPSRGLLLVAYERLWSVAARLTHALGERQRKAVRCRKRGRKAIAWFPRHAYDVSGG